MTLLMGLALPFDTMLVALSVAFVLVFFVAILLLVCKKATRKTALPFVPFLAIGAIAAHVLEVLP